MYDTLDINQKITLKDLIINKKFRNYILGPKNTDNKTYRLYELLALMGNWKESINLFLEPK